MGPLLFRGVKGGGRHAERTTPKQHDEHKRAKEKDVGETSFPQGFRNPLLFSVQRRGCLLGSPAANFSGLEHGCFWDEALPLLLHAQG